MSDTKSDPRNCSPSLVFWLTYLGACLLSALLWLPHGEVGLMVAAEHALSTLILLALAAFQRRFHGMLWALAWVFGGMALILVPLGLLALLYP
jgi:hypothetical protein